MSKLENISALLVVTNSEFTKEAAYTTKTTRAELIQMLQAADTAISKTLEVGEDCVKVSDQLVKDKQVLSAEVQELNDCIKRLESKLEREANAVTQLVKEGQNLEAQNESLQQKCSELEAELVTTNKELADSKHYAATLQHQVHKYKQQGFFARLFGRTPE